MSDAAHAATEAATDAALAPPAGEPLRVLVVDDDAVDRMIVRRALTRARLTVDLHEADSAVDALAQVAARTFDCVILDYNIPDGDGVTLLKGIRRAGLAVPVIALTGQGDEQVAVELMKAGAADYLPKSALTPDRLAQSLRYAVELARAAAATRAMQDELRDVADRTRFLAEASRVLGGSLDVDTTMAAIARLGVPRLGERCVVFVAEPEGVRLVASAPADPERRDAAPLGESGGAVLQAIRTGRTQHLPSAIVVPLVARGEVLGAAAFVRGAPTPHDARDVALAEDLAQRAAMALDNARLFAMAREARRRAEDAAARTDRLQRLTAALAGAATEHDAGELVMRHGVLPTGAYAGVIAERTADGDAIELLTCVGYPPEACMQVGRRWPADAPLPLAEAVRTGAPVFVASPEAWAERYAGGYAPAQAPAGAAPGSASRAWAALPLAGDAGVHGAILWTFAAPRDFDAEERALMAAVAQQCAQALERARLREAERRARAEAEEANRAKSVFHARMSHDQRTPLNAIGGYAQLIELGVHGPVTDAQTHAIGRIRRAQEHLLTLINDILSFAKLEAGQVVVTLEPVSVRALVDELASLVRPEAARRGLALGVDAGPDGLLVRADGGRLMQVLLNLTSNALKFTDAGTVGLGVAAGDDWVELRVSDSGRGIPRDRLAAIFDPFVQARGAADEQKGGVGLGLAIGRELARLMGGDLIVASDEGRGSTFTVRLPRS
ncbi:MAG: ATP-binding protein [Gemmatirosa sp.]